MGKKGGGKKGGKGKGGKAGGWQPIQVPDEPLMVRPKVGTFLTIIVRGVVWRVMDFTERVPASMKVFELHSMIRSRHGDGVVEFTLYKEEKHLRNKLDDMNAALGSLEFSNASEDAERVFYYEFEPRIDDCPLLLCAPHNLRIEAIHKAEKDREAAELAAREAKLAGLKKGTPNKSGLDDA
jgi:hypothetical protein